MASHLLQTTQRTTYADVPDRRGSNVPDEKQTRRLEMRSEAAERNVEELEHQRQQLEQELGDTWATYADVPDRTKTCWYIMSLQ